MYWQNLKCMDLQCSKIEACKVHSKTITVLEVEGGRIITGSEDRTLKVSYCLSSVQFNLTLELRYVCL